ncbi:hypothetical protein F5878DRAFT_601862 [Lentinula raphanica]|uniref:Uncharacterized protein n=1 Tax=Lentinula raphanica TaxID=153919 RepID=A0AA38PKW1_9AGAR|nr:hypothetical protein F5878DRAFT_601862 [Lentinula raphanica]
MQSYALKMCLITVIIVLSAIQVTGMGSAVQTRDVEARVPKLRNGKFSMHWSYVRSPTWEGRHMLVLRRMLPNRLITLPSSSVPREKEIWSIAIGHHYFLQAERSSQEGLPAGRQIWKGTGIRTYKDPTHHWTTKNIFIIGYVRIDTKLAAPTRCSPTRRSIFWAPSRRFPIFTIW